MRHKIAKETLNIKSKAKGILTSDFKKHYSEAKVNSAWDWHVLQQKRTETPQINPHSYHQLIHDNWATTTPWGKDSLFQ